MKVRIGNSQDFIEQEFATKAEAVAYIQNDGVVLKQALKALAVAVPITVDVKTDTATGQTTQQVERPVQPQQYQGSTAEICPNCGQKKLYTNITKSVGQNQGKRYKRCGNKACLVPATGKPYFDPYECSRYGSK